MCRGSGQGSTYFLLTHGWALGFLRHALRRRRGNDWTTFRPLWSRAGQASFPAAPQPR